MHNGLNYNKDNKEEIAPSCDDCAYRDVKIAFRVSDAEQIDRIINVAQITDTKTDYDTDDYKIQDIDSKPNNYGNIYDDDKSREDDEDIAVIIPDKFSLALNKWISSYQVIVSGKVQEFITGQDATSTESEKYTDKLAKIDVDGNKLNKTNVIVKYGIRITNNGDIPGYVKEITDYIPVGMEFIQEDNINLQTGKPYWVLSGNQAITSDGYQDIMNTLLQPGEYIELTINLRWKSSSENMDLKVNLAEISMDANDWNVKDCNSELGNLAQDEDDIDKVPLLITVKTGEYMIHYATIIGGLSLLLVIVIFLKKKVINQDRG